MLSLACSALSRYSHLTCSWSSHRAAQPVWSTIECGGPGLWRGHMVSPASHPPPSSPPASTWWVSWPPLTGDWPWVGGDGGVVVRLVLLLSWPAQTSTLTPSGLCSRSHYWAAKKQQVEKWEVVGQRSWSSTVVSSHERQAEVRLTQLFCTGQTFRQFRLLATRWDRLTQNIRCINTTSTASCFDKLYACHYIDCDTGRHILQSRAESLIGESSVYFKVRKEELLLRSKDNTHLFEMFLLVQ